MSQQDTIFWITASHAREKLEEQMQDRADVCFVDIGYPQNGSVDDEISLRIHVCKNSAAEFDGIPVIVSAKR